MMKTIPMNATNSETFPCIWKTAQHGTFAGLCSEERSTISPDYARNFICDFILGKKQAISQPSLFD